MSDEKALTVREAAGILQRLIDHGHADNTLVIHIQKSGVMGPSPSVAIKGFSSGFDWDSGKVFARVSEPLAIHHAKEMERENILYAMEILYSHREHPNKPGYKRSDIEDRIKRLKEKLDKLKLKEE